MASLRVSVIFGKLPKAVKITQLCSSTHFPQQTTSCFYATRSELVPKKLQDESKYKLVVVGGGTGGCAVAAKFSSLGKSLAVIEPNDQHFYQPLWTLVGGGLKGFQQSQMAMREVLPQKCEWIKDSAVTFEPDKNRVILKSGEKVSYDYLVIGMGIQVDYHKVPGLEKALENDPRVSSIYNSKWVLKTFPAMQNFRGGNAIFTFPNTPIKCAGAPQKIMYLADEFFRKANVRKDSKVIFNTSLGVIFGVKKYADALQKVIAKRDINVNYQHCLTEIDHEKQLAVFSQLNNDNKRVDFKYDFLHVTPPMSSPDVLKKSPLVNEGGWLDLNKHTLQHVKYTNIFGLGDCTSLPTSKTAAAAAAQSGILHRNLKGVMDGKKAVPMYDGYTSCPLVTSSQTCILAEFDYDAKPLETLPINQGKERHSSYLMKSLVLPEIYWRLMTTGYWNGPKTVRKLLHLGLSRSPQIKT